MVPEIVPMRIMFIVDRIILALTGIALNVSVVPAATHSESGRSTASLERLISLVHQMLVLTIYAMLVLQRLSPWRLDRRLSALRADFVSHPETGIRRGLIIRPFRAFVLSPGRHPPLRRAMSAKRNVKSLKSICIVD
jgi:hypothetical protein